MKLALKRAEKPEVEVPTIIGEQFGGGYYFGRIAVGVDLFALVVPSNSERYCKRPFAWSDSEESVIGARSHCDGLANTRAMAAVGNKLAQWALDQRIGGFDDWYLMSRQDALVFHSNQHLASEKYLRDEEYPRGTADYDGWDTERVWTSTQCHLDSTFAWAMGLKHGNHVAINKETLMRGGIVRRVKI